MKILYFGYPSSTKGAPHQEMASIYLSKRNNQIDYICWGGVLEDAGFNVQTMNYMPQPKTGIFSAIKMLFKLMHLLLRDRTYDVVYVQGAQQTPFLFWLPFLNRRKRIIYHTQDYLEPRRHCFYERFEKWFSRNADFVLCNEPNRARFMKSHYGLKYMPAVVRTALPNWWPIPDRSIEVRKEILRHAGMDDSEDVIIIVAGGAYRADRMSPQLLQAFARLPENFIIVFNGPDMEEGGGCKIDCENKMKELGITSRVVCMGGLSFNELLSLYSAAEIGILLYPNDGVGHYYQCPGRFSEYLRCGLSLVSSNFMGLELLTLKYNLGAICDSEDPSSIYKALLATGKTTKVNRSHIITTAETEFVYEKEAVVLDRIIEGTYEHPKPSVLT